MPVYRLICGTHQGPGPASKVVTLRKGETTESEHDLITMFPGKFELVRQDRPKPVMMSATEMNPNSAGTSANQTMSAEDEPTGWEDVTSRFAAASDDDLTVHYKRGVGYMVKDGDRDLFDQPVRNSVQVSNFLKKRKEGDDGSAGEGDGD